MPTMPTLLDGAIKMKCKGITKTGAPCRAQAIDGDYCEWHIGQASSGGEVRTIDITSTELQGGQTIHRKALAPRPRIWKPKRRGWGE